MNGNPDLRKALGLFADEERFRIAAAISLGANTPEKVASMTGLDITRVMKSIVKLESAGIIEKKADKGYKFNFNILHTLTKGLSAGLPAKAQSTGLDRFMKDGRLITYPSRPDDQLLVLQFLAGLFEQGKEYSEKEVNEKLKAVNPDFAALRRYLYDKGFFDRKRINDNEGRTVTVYWRVK